MFIRHRGKTKLVSLPWTTSNVGYAGGIVAWSSGRLIMATSTTAPSAHVGVLREAVATTDAKYTTAGNVMVEVPTEVNVEWLGDAASLTTSTVGTFLDISDSKTVNGGASTYDVVQHVGYISATKGIFILNLGIGGMGIVGA
jgi:hypothetical protein